MRYLAFPIIVSFALVAARGIQGAEGDNDLAQDQKRVLGGWNVTAYDQDGRPMPAETVKKMSVSIKAGKLIISPKVVIERKTSPKSDGKKKEEVKFVVEEGKSDEVQYRLSRAGKRKVIELTQDIGRGQSRKIKGLYALASDTLTICIPLTDRTLPKKIPDSAKAGLVRLVLVRATEPKAANAKPDEK
jgi:uncharacterized protein (TIGR03067 family)